MGLQKSKLYQSDIDAAIMDNPWISALDGSSFFISGATGMIGSVIVDILMKYNEHIKDAKHKIHIVAVSRREEVARERFADYWNDDTFTYVSHDISHPLPELGSIDYILHAASNTHPRAYATDPIGTITTNVNGTYGLLNYASSHDCKRFLCFSSVEIYGENRNDTEDFDESYLGYIDCNTLRSGYPESKRVSESLCNAFATQKGLDFVIGRFSRVYGPTMGQHDSKAIAQFIQKSVAGEDIILKSKGNQLYSYTYVVDAAIASLYLLIYGKSQEAYNIADDSSVISLKDLAQILADEAGTQVIFELPDDVEKAGYSTATKAILNTRKIHDLGYYTKTSIKEGLTKTVRVLKEIS